LPLDDLSLTDLSGPLDDLNLDLRLPLSFGMAASKYEQVSKFAA
jgi:DNA-binding MltR family transcriptional regulator